MRERHVVQSEGPSVKKSYKSSKTDQAEKFQSKVRDVVTAKPSYAKCVSKNEYQAGEDSTRWFYSPSVISERGDTHVKSIESDSFYSDRASSSSND